MAIVRLIVRAAVAPNGVKEFQIAGLPPPGSTFTPGAARRLAETLRELALEVERRLDAKPADTFTTTFDW
jgi:hypothetical protein